VGLPKWIDAIESTNTLPDPGVRISLQFDVQTLRANDAGDPDLTELWRECFNHGVWLEALWHGVYDIQDNVFCKTNLES
jgi:hypothetical protein